MSKKLLNNKPKPLREGKDVLDFNKTVIMEDNTKETVGYAIQMKGLWAQIIFVNLTSNGVYVGNIDENDWIQLKNGKWFHSEASVTLNGCPYEEYNCFYKE